MSGLLGRRTFLQGGLATAAVLVAGCNRGGGSPSGRLDAARSAPPQPLDAGGLPARERPTLRASSGGDAGCPTPFSYMPTAYYPLSLVYDTLLWSDSTGTVVPWLAARHEVAPDGMTHVFELREGVRWHDGRFLTADDVVFSVEYFKAKAQERKVGPFVLFPPDHISSVRSRGNLVEVTLDKPAVTFASDVAARFPIVPRHVWESVDNPAQACAEKDVVVGSGPYRLERYGRTNFLLTANDDFFLGRPFVERVELVPVADELVALRAGKIDIGGFQPRPAAGRVLDVFRSDPKFDVLEGPPDFVTALYWNLDRGGPMADVRFRRACAHAIDREEMVERLLGGMGHPGNPGFLPPGHRFQTPVEQYRFDPAAAGRLLDEAGYRRATGGARVGSDGKALRVKLAADPMLAPAVEFVVRSLQAVGVKVEVDPVNEFLIGEDYEMALLFYGGIGEDADYMRRVYSTRVDKLFMAADGYANPEVDDLADRQLVALDEAERGDLLARLQGIVAADLPLLHLYYPTPFVVFRTAVADAQWVAGEPADPFNKHGLVTGLARSGNEIRPTK